MAYELAAEFDPRNPQLQATSGKVPPILRGYNEGASAAFHAGQLVYLASSVVTVCTAGDTPVMGIALRDGTVTGQAGSLQEIPIQVIGRDDELLMQVCTSAGVLEVSNTTCAPGVAYDIQTVNSTLHYIDSSDTSNMKFVFLGPTLDSQGAATTWGRFRPIYVENQATAE